MNLSFSQTCGTGSFFQWDTIDWVGRGKPIPPIRFFDNTGAEYDSTTLTIPNAIVGNCNAGIFTIIFDDPYPFPDPLAFFTDTRVEATNNPNLFGFSMGDIRRNLVCQVFRDISDILFDVNPNNSGRVIVRVSAQTSVGLMTTFPIYAVPYNLPNHLVLDNEAYKTIVSGINSYTQYPTSANINNFYHCRIDIDPTLDWHYDLSEIPSSNTVANADLILGNRDFYSVLLHEVLHLLGFVNAGSSLDFSRYQRFLTYNNNLVTPTPYIIQNPIGVWNMNTPPTPSNCGAIGMKQFQLSQNPPVFQEAYDANGHLSCNIGLGCPYGQIHDSNDFVITNCSGLGGEFVKRHPNEVEKNIICRLGYTLNVNNNGQLVYGNGNSQLTPHIYQSSCFSACKIISQPDYGVTVQNNPLTISPLVNDINAVGGVVTQLLNFSPNAGSIVQNNNNFVFTPTLGFTGWAVLSYVPRCANGELGGTNYIFIYIPDCNSSTTIGVQGTNTLLSNVLPLLSNNVSFTIEGNLQIDTDYAILGSNVLMGAGASIEIMPNTTLTLGNATCIHSCSDMWEGIKVLPNASLLANNVLIEDAEHAIEGFANTTISVTNSRFHKNNIALWLPDQNGVTPLPNSLALTFENNLIDCTNAQLLPPYPSGTISRAGIAADNFEIQLGEENRFEDMQNGIMVLRCNLSVKNCYFRHIRHPQFPLGMEGTAIFAQNTDTYSREIKVIGFGKHNQTNFEDCRTGIQNQGAYLSMLAQDNRMENVDIGIIARRNTLAHHVNSLFNYIQCRRIGIYYVHEEGALESQINFNEVQVNNMPKGGKGIWVSDNKYTSFPPPPHQLNLNEVRLMQAFAGNGIELDYSVKPEVMENLVTIYDPNVRAGMLFANTQSATAQCNTVNTNGINANNGNAYGFPIALNLAAATNGSYTCNYLYNTRTGIKIESDCSGTELKGNEMHDHHIGLHYNAVGKSGNQGFGTQRNGNKWFGNFGVAAQHDGALPYIYGSLFQVASFVSPFTPTTFTFLGSSFTPTSPGQVWFSQSNAANYQCDNTSVCASFAQRIGQSEVTFIDSLVATNQFDSGIYQEELTWLEKRALYEKILSDSTLLQDSLLNTFFFQMQDSSAAWYQDFEENRKTQLTLTPISEVTLRALSNQIQLYGDSLRVIYQSLVVDNLSQTDSQLLMQAKEGLEQTLSSTQNLYSAAIQGINALRDSVSDILQTENGLLPSLKLYEYNEKVVNTIYLATLSKGIDTFSVFQKFDLESIANQCPLSGGEGVYLARSLVRLFNDSTDYDDKALCFAEGINYRHSIGSEKEGVYQLYPNPTNNTLNIHSQTNQTENGQIIFVNSLGVTVKNIPFSFSSGNASISTQEIPVGFYHVKVWLNNQFVLSQKIAIIH